MPPPSGVSDTLDLPVDPQLGHELPDPFGAGAGEYRPQTRRVVGAAGLHAFENDAGVVAHSSSDARAVVLAGWIRGRYNQGMAVTLSARERAGLKARAHSLEPVVRIGNAGVTPELAAEVDRALTAHELIKVSIAVDDRDERRTLGDTLAGEVGAASVHRVGKILILWRPRPHDA